MHARMTTMEMDPNRMDAAVSQVEQENLPEWKELAGFRGFTLLADRTSGKIVATSYWNSEAEMDAAEEPIKDARRQAAETGGANEEPRVERFEVAVDSFTA